MPISESSIQISDIFDEVEILNRHTEYESISDKDFDSTRKDYAFKPVSMIEDGNITTIQYNYCYDTFCPNHGEPLSMIKFRGARSQKNYSYGSSKSEASIRCNLSEYFGSPKSILNNTTMLLSNLSVAEEIKRLKTLSSVKTITYEYTFHDSGCPNLNDTPKNNSGAIVKFGKTSAGSERYRCKTCGKTTSIKPSLDKNFSYNQKRNDILIDLVKDVLGRAPVRQTCEKLIISPDTYYSKIEWIYQKCLEFLARHESKIKEHKYEDLYIATDLMSYSLNNIRKKGKGGNSKTPEEKANAQDATTSILASGDVLSSYIFRADICYDYEVRLNDIEEDTITFHSDHTYPYLRKYERINRFTYYPMPPTKLDSQSEFDYQTLLFEFEARKKFVDGLHTKINYTSIAHFHILNEMLNFKRIIFVSDNDVGLQSAVFRTFKDTFKNGVGYYIVSKFDKTNTRKDSYKEYVLKRNELTNWANTNRMLNASKFDIGVSKMYSQLQHYDFFAQKLVDGFSIKTNSKDTIEHPIPAKDEGGRTLRLVSNSDVSDLWDISEMMVRSNTRVVDNFFQVLRRHVNILERPLVGARSASDGKTYIYANYNPKYAHMLITILRTFYNFCWTRKYLDKKIMTPAQRLGISDKVFKAEDIIYFR